jgi:hypothetical protein
MGKIYEKMKPEWKKMDMDIDKDCLCKNCKYCDRCPFSWDLYNHGDSCLWGK